MWVMCVDEDSGVFMQFKGLNSTSTFIVGSAASTEHMVGISINSQTLCLKQHRLNKKKCCKE